MKKIVLTFGLISGAIAALMMFVTIPLIVRVPFEYLTVLGYTTFVACFLMVFFGIRSYRDNVAGGTITLITLISALILRRKQPKRDGESGNAEIPHSFTPAKATNR